MFMDFSNFLLRVVYPSMVHSNKSWSADRETITFHWIGTKWGTCYITKVSKCYVEKDVYVNRLESVILGM